MSPSSAQSISDSPATTRLESPSSPLLLDGSKEVPGLDGWRYTGPAIESGIVTPVVVYLALTATQSLEVAPINDFVTKLNGLTQPTTTTTISSYNENIVETTLNHDHIRIFSPTLPFHSDVDMAANEAVFHQWADTYLSGGDIASSFARHVDGAVTMLANAPFTDRTAGVHIVGLSRGALFAGLVAARNQHVRSLTAFAPVVSLLTLSEFEENEGVMQNQRILDKISAMTLTADDVVKQLVHNRVDVRCYMGNVDVRVGTRHAFDFAHALAISANEQGVRSPPHEFIMYPRYVSPTAC